MQINDFISSQLNELGNFDTYKMKLTSELGETKYFNIRSHEDIDLIANFLKSKVPEGYKPY